MQKGKHRGATKEVTSANEIDTGATFTLPDSLPCSEVSFPILIKRRPKIYWNDIIKESEDHKKAIEEYTESKHGPQYRPPFQKTETDYVKDEIFGHLLPAVEEALNKAKLWGVFQNPYSFFNGIDWIVQLLWNNNPRHPERLEKNLHLFNMPWVREALKVKPRPYYPKSWLWTEDYAATLIQKTLRQYLVQRDEEVQEMREFWRKLELEKELQIVEANPMLAKKFACERKIPRRP